MLVIYNCSRSFVKVDTPAEPLGGAATPLALAASPVKHIKSPKLSSVISSSADEANLARANQERLCWSEDRGVSTE